MSAKKDDSMAFATSPPRVARRNSPPQVCKRRQPLMNSSSQPARQMVVLEIGTGCDLHGQDITKAAVRACRNAVEFNSLPVLERLCPDGDLSEMLVVVKLGVPESFTGAVDIEAVKGVFPYGTKEVNVVPGGLIANSGIYLPEQDDKDGDVRALVVVAAVEVHC